MTTLTGKTAVVTGGTSGIGLAIAKRLSAQGAHVFITGRRQSELDAAVAAIGGDVTGVQGDISNLADLDRLYERITQQTNRIDILVANAGGGEFAPLGAISEEHYDRTFDINVKGTLFTVQKALPLMPDGSTIILMGSTAGVSGNPAFSVYGATKAAIRSFARSWTVDLKERHIRVNVVSPGPIVTPGIDWLAPDSDQAAQLRAMLAATVPMGRMGDPDEVAKAVLFLASDESSFVSGAELFVDGGQVQI